MFIDNKFSRYILLLTLVHVCLAVPAGAYYVNGVVDFSYSSYSSKIGDTRTTSSAWTEHYGVGAGGILIDPRVFRWNARVDYSSTHAEGGSDSDILGYSINASFFPGRAISWDLFAAQGVTEVQTSSNIGGYNVRTTGYGGSLGLRLSSFRGRTGNNNNQNNNYYNNRRSSYLPLPDIFLSTSHNEAESRNIANPIRETRDSHSGSLRYRLGSSSVLDFSAKLETFENELDGSGYETSNLQLVSTSRISTNGELKMTGETAERETQGIQGLTNSSIRTTAYAAYLSFRPVGRVSHSYQYNLTRHESGATENVSQSAAAEVQYAYLPELRFRGGARYAEIEIDREATAATSASNYTMIDGSVFLGAQYRKLYRPDFLDPFTFSTGYDLTSGFSSTENEQSEEEGKGRYYQNNVSLGLRSTGWKYELVSLDYSLTSRRDHSPLDYDSRSEQTTLGLATSRLPRTTIRANGSYLTRQSSSNTLAGYFLQTPGGTVQSNRTLQYDASIDHALKSYLSLNAGATRSRTTSKAEYTLANITTDLETTDVTVYAGATLNYQITRNLSFRVFAREEVRRREPGDANDTTAYIVNSLLNYRIRKIILNAEHRWREDIRRDQPRNEQQYFFVKISRPF